jgi:hypothetical protein
MISRYWYWREKDFYYDRKLIRIFNKLTNNCYFNINKEKKNNQQIDGQ